MTSVQSVLRNALMPIKASQTAAGYVSRSAFYSAIQQGLLPRPIKVSGSRAAALPAYELEAVNAARIAGKSDDDIRKLVQHLHEQRQAAAQVEA